MKIRKALAGFIWNILVATIGFYLLTETDFPTWASIGLIVLSCIWAVCSAIEPLVDRWIEEKKNGTDSKENN